MRVFVISDMEGVSGVVKWEQVEGGEALYEEARKLYTEEINAAVRGAKAGWRDGDRRHGLPRGRQGVDVQLAPPRAARPRLRVGCAGRVVGVHGVPGAGLRCRAPHRDARQGRLRSAAS